MNTDNQSQQEVSSVQPSPQESAPVPPNKSISKLLISIVAIIIIFVGVGGYFLATNKTKTQQAIITPTPLPTEASAKAGDPTANWKTYTNSKYGFSFMYPSDKYLDDWGEGRLDLRIDLNNKKEAGFPGELIFTIDVIPAKSNLQDYMEQYVLKDPQYDLNDPNRPKLDVKNSNIGNLPAYIVERKPIYEAPNINSYIAYFQKGKYLYEVGLYTGNVKELEDNKQVLDQILSTFRFAN